MYLLPERVGEYFSDLAPSRGCVRDCLATFTRAGCNNVQASQRSVAFVGGGEGLGDLRPVTRLRL